MMKNTNKRKPLSFAESVIEIENCAGFDDKSTGVGKAWKTIKDICSWKKYPKKKPKKEGYYLCLPVGLACENSIPKVIWFGKQKNGFSDFDEFVTHWCEILKMCEKLEE